MSGAEPRSGAGVDLKAMGELLASERRGQQLSQRGALVQVRKRRGRVVSMRTLQGWEGGERLPEGEELADYLCGLGASVERVMALTELFCPAPSGAELFVSPKRWEGWLSVSPWNAQATVLPMLLDLLRCWVTLASLGERFRQLEALAEQAGGAPLSGSG